VLRCVDQDGQAVSNATVMSGVSLDGNPETTTQMNGKTDTNGCFVVDGKSNGELGCYCKKIGFYDTCETIRLEQFPGAFVSGGRWQPYGATNTVVLKRKVNPVAMYCKTVNVALPIKGQDFGFDCKVGDLVKPYGSGSEPDFILNYSLVYDTNSVWNATNHLYISFTPPNGAIVLKADESSQMRTVYAAPENGYGRQIVFYYKGETKLRREKKEFLADEYIVFKSRTEHAANGCETNMHFGKIISRGFWYGENLKDGVGGGVVFSYFWNPTPNDRNLEFDGEHNLFNLGRDESWPHDP